MTITNLLRRPLLLLGSMALCGWAPATPAGAQAYTPPPPPLTTAPCKPTKKDPCSTPPLSAPPATPSQFPFPGEASGNPPPAASAPVRGKGAAPAAAKDPSQSPSFPFPGEPAQSSSSSSSSTSDAGDPHPEAGDDPSSPGPAAPSRFTRRKLPKVESKTDREAEDLEVSKYYTSAGNFQAAYMRARDAVASVPDDPEAHLALARTAGRLKKNDEAVAEYKRYLQLEPDGDEVPAARRALTQLLPK